jgi:prepilin-type N-terminal cleavage/methylation domain-containing protein
MHANHHHQCQAARCTRRGFTLIETALATVIVGTGVVAIVAAQQAFFRQNEWSTHASTAQRLGNEIREFTLHLPRHDPVTGQAFWGPESSELDVLDFDDLDDFDGEDGEGTVFSAALGSGPISALGDVFPDKLRRLNDAERRLLYQFFGVVSACLAENPSSFYARG